MPKLNKFRETVTAHERMTTKAALGWRLEAKRRRHGMTRAEAARELGTSRTTYGQWEAGRMSDSILRGVMLSTWLDDPDPPAAPGEEPRRGPDDSRDTSG